MKKSIILGTFIIYAQIVLGQWANPNVGYPSPTASSLGIFGEIPVSLHSGLAAIDIPLYEIVEGDIKVPIGLKYHTSGVRPDVHPGPTGNGWALNCGGIIMRIVKGESDEHSSVQRYIVPGSGTFFDRNRQSLGQLQNTLLWNNDWATPLQIENNAKIRSFYETEPDEFSFNFLGYSGKFTITNYLNAQNEVVQYINVITDPSIKIMLDTYERTYTTSNQSFTYLKQNYLGNVNLNAYIAVGELKIKGFKIITADGSQYEFGSYNESVISTNDLPFESSVDFFTQINDFHNWDTWYLRKITSSTGKTMNFEYGLPNGDTERKSIVSFGLTKVAQKTNAATAGSTFYQTNYSGKVILATYVTKITTSTEIVKFNYSTTKELEYNYYAIFNDLYNKYYDYNKGNWDPNIRFSHPPSDVLILRNSDGTFAGLNGNAFQWKQLDNIIITKKVSNEKVKSFEFNYSSSSSVRLTLNSIINKGASNDIAPLTYTFRYNNSKTLPVYNSFQTDHWGFFNGKTPPEFVNLSDAEFNTFSIYKEPDINFLQAGILDKITYPTGGYTEFTYEPHTYTSKVLRDASTGNFSLTPTVPLYAGGLRIKQIKSNAGISSSDVIKTYQYFDGILSGEAQYFWKNYVGKVVNGNTYTCDRFLSQTILPVSTNSVGSHIGYSKVREIINGSGYIDYTYSNYDVLDNNFEATIDINKSRYSPFSSKSCDRGLLLKKETFNQIFQPISRVEYQYQPYDPTRFFRAMNTKIFRVLGATAIEGTSYKIFNYPKFPTQQITTVFNTDGSSVITTESLSYESTYNFLAKKETTDSRGNTNKITYKYPFDYVTFPTTQVTPSAFSNSFSHMLWNNMLAYPVETVTTKTINNIENVTGATLNNYAGFFLEDEAPVLLPSNTKTLTLETPIPITNFTSASVALVGNIETLNNDARYTTAISYDRYDASANIIQTTLNNLQNKAYQWGYNNQYPVAQVTNAKVKNIFYDSFEEGNGNSPLQDDKTGRFSYIGAYSKTLNNVDAGNYTLSYWQKTASDEWLQVNTPITLTATTYTINLSGQIDDVCFYPQDAQITTYTYEPLLGMTSMTDPKGMTTYYEYDSFQRLKNVKDQNGNILKNTDYVYGQGNAAYQAFIQPNWVSTGNSRLKRIPPDGTIIGSEYEYKDQNPNSLTYLQIKWILSSLGF